MKMNAKCTAELLDKARRFGWSSVAVDHADTLEEAREIGKWLREQLDNEFQQKLKASAARGEFRKLAVRDRVVKFR